MAAVTITKTDLDALELALAQTLAEPDPGRVEQVRNKLQYQDRIEVAEFCSYHRQCRALNLQPWQIPPCWVDDADETLASNLANDHRGERAAAQLLQQMLQLGVSRYHPDPEAAIAEAQKRKAKV